MPGAARKEDKCSGHDCWPSRPNDEASSNVFVNGKGFHRNGDHWETHCCNGNCHDSTLSGGSSSVFVNGKKAGRIGDAVACGSTVKDGSGNVFVGG